MPQHEHDWKIDRWRRMNIFTKLWTFVESCVCCIQYGITYPETPWHYWWVDWHCAICGDTHTTIEDSRIPVYDEPGTMSWDTLNAMWDLKFGRD